MKNLTNLDEEELVSNLDKPIAACIMLLGVAAVALVVALGFFFGIGLLNPPKNKNPHNMRVFLWGASSLLLAFRLQQ